MWNQAYDPLHSPLLSTLLAALPLVVLLGLLARHGVRAHYAALLGLATTLTVAIVAQHMPAGMAFRAAAFGAAYGLFPIGWIVLNVLFLHALASERSSTSCASGSRA
jgi:lactate permease